MLNTIRGWFTGRSKTEKIPTVAKLKGGQMFCLDCGRAIHRGDRFKIIGVRHVDCLDPRRMGQMPLRPMLQLAASTEERPSGTGGVEQD